MKLLAVLILKVLEHLIKLHRKLLSQISHQLILSELKGWTFPRVSEEFARC